MIVVVGFAVIGVVVFICPIVELTSPLDVDVVIMAVV